MDVTWRTTITSIEMFNVYCGTKIIQLKWCENYLFTMAACFEFECHNDTHWNENIQLSILLISCKFGLLIQNVTKEFDAELNEKEVDSGFILLIVSHYKFAPSFASMSTGCRFCKTNNLLKVLRSRYRRINRDGRKICWNQSMIEHDTQPSSIWYFVTCLDVISLFPKINQ